MVLTGVIEVEGAAELAEGVTPSAISATEGDSMTATVVEVDAGTPTELTEDEEGSKLVPEASYSILRPLSAITEAIFSALIEDIMDVVGVPAGAGVVTTVGGDVPLAS